jgi:hypothetical protein
VQQLRDSQQKYAVTGQTQQAQALAGNESDQCVVPRTISNVRNAIFGSYNQLNVYEVVHKQDGPAETTFNDINITLPEILGREHEIEKLVRRVLSYPSAVHGIEGLLGIGKTTLALAVCKRYCTGYQVHASSGSVGSSSDAYRCYVVEFSHDLDSAQEMYRSALTQVFGSQFGSPDLGHHQCDFRLQLSHMCKRLGKGCILLLDSCENCTTSQKLTTAFGNLLRDFLNYSDGIKIITTSCKRLSFQRLQYIKFELEPLREEAAVQLLANICGTEVSVGDDSVLKRIASHCYYHPSALHLVASWLESGSDSVGLLEELEQSQGNPRRKMRLLNPPSELIWGETVQLIPCLRIFFDQLANHSYEGYLSLLYLSLLPGPFNYEQFRHVLETAFPSPSVWGWPGQNLSLMVWSILQRGFFLQLSMSNRPEEGYWKLQPLIRDFAELRRLEDTTINENTKQWFLTFYSNLLPKIASMFHSDTNELLKMFDTQIYNIRLFLRCAVETEWISFIEARPARAVALFQSLLAPNVSYLLKFRFQASFRLEVYQSLRKIITHLVIPDVDPILGEAEVLLEMAIIQGRTKHEFPELQEALSWIKKASIFFAGKAVYEHYRAVTLAVRGSIIFKLSKLTKAFSISRMSDVEKAENMLSTAWRLCNGLRQKSYQEKDTAAYYKWTDHLAWIVKELASICGKCPAR